MLTIVGSLETITTQCLVAGLGLKDIVAVAVSSHVTKQKNLCDSVHENVK